MTPWGHGFVVGLSLGAGTMFFVSPLVWDFLLALYGFKSWDSMATRSSESE